MCKGRSAISFSISAHNLRNTPGLSSSSVERLSSAACNRVFSAGDRSADVSVDEDVGVVGAGGMSVGVQAATSAVGVTLCYSSILFSCVLSIETFLCSSPLVPVESWRVELPTVESGNFFSSMLESSKTFLQGRHKFVSFVEFFRHHEPATALCRRPRRSPFLHLHSPSDPYPLASIGPGTGITLS